MDRERLPRRVYEWELERDFNKGWIGMTKKLLRELGLEEHWNRQYIEESKGMWGKLIWEKIQEREERQWWEDVCSKPKLRTYKEVKKKLVREKYLSSQETKGRRALARIRSGCNELRIESGRQAGEEIKDRICWFGCNKVEDEKHFLLECELYVDQREEFIRDIGREQFGNRGWEILLGLGEEDEVNATMVFINRALARRRRILELRGG